MPFVRLLRSHVDELAAAVAAAEPSRPAKRRRPPAAISTAVGLASGAVDEVLQQVAREWSPAGESERAAAFRPLVRRVEALLAGGASRRRDCHSAALSTPLCLCQVFQ